MKSIKRKLYHIRIWIVFFFLIRLIGITNPPLEAGHNWRQSFTNMVARNFYEENSNIFYPTIDMSGNRNGTVASEFPIFNYLIYLLSSVFGYQHWYGRLINLIFSSFGFLYFYRIVFRMQNKKIAFISTFLLIISVWFAFSRKSMPDTFSISLTIIGIFYCIEYFRTNKNYYLLLYVVFCSLGVLSKIPALYFLGFYILPFWGNKILSKQLILFSISTGIILIIVYLWYFYWIPYLLTEFGNQLYYPKGIYEGIVEIIPYWKLLLEKFYFTTFHSYIIIIFLIYGIYLIFKEDNRFRLPVISSIFIFIIFIIKTGAVFPTHNYYIIPIIPILAIFTAKAIDKFKYINSFIILTLISIESIANQNHDFFIKESEKYVANLESLSNEYTKKDDLIAINGNGNPQKLYFCNRKGWIVKNELLLDTNFCNSLYEKGCKYIYVDKLDNDLNLNYILLHNDKFFKIYKLKYR